MHAWRLLVISTSLLWASILVIAGCAGGSGSSGFDISANSENDAIELALEQQDCVDFEGLLICPAGTTIKPPDQPPTPSRTTTPPISALPTATPAGIPSTPTTTPAGIPTTPMPTARQTETASPTPTSTATPTIVPEPDIGLELRETDTVECLDAGIDGLCDLLIPFVPVGFPPDATFRVAVRLLDPVTLEPEGDWIIGEPPHSTGSMGAPSFDASISAVSTAEAAEGTLIVQIAVLVFEDTSEPIPEAVPLLGQAGAYYAFVTKEITIATAP